MQAGMENFFAPQELTFLSDFYVIIEHRFLEERIFGNEWQKRYDTNDEAILRN